MMRGLTLKQPLAGAIALLGKDVENRSWSTPYRGLVAIHAGKGIDRQAGVGDGRPLFLPGAGIIAVVDLFDCVRDSRSRWAMEGSYHFLLRNVRLLRSPVPCSGRLGLWTLGEQLERLVLEQL